MSADDYDKKAFDSFLIAIDLIRTKKDTSKAAYNNLDLAIRYWKKAVDLDPYNCYLYIGLFNATREILNLNQKKDEEKVKLSFNYIDKAIELMESHDQSYNINTTMGSRFDSCQDRTKKECDLGVFYGMRAYIRDRKDPNYKKDLIKSCDLGCKSSCIRLEMNI